MKLNITPGPWYKDKFGIYDEFGEHFIETNIEVDDAAAIVTAVNNTYHKGINPEAVPEMLEVAKELDVSLPILIFEKKISERR